MTSIASKQIARRYFIEIMNQANMATLEQIQSTLNQPAFYGIPASPAVIASINKARPFVANREQASDLDRVFRAFVDKATGGKKNARAAESGGPLG